MDIVVISQENKILHIRNLGYSAEYYLYNSKGKLLSNSILESYYGRFNNEEILTEIINSIKENTSFSEPYMFLYGSNTIPLLSLIRYENNKKGNNYIEKYIRSLNTDSDYFYYQRERWLYAQ